MASNGNTAESIFNRSFAWNEKAEGRDLVAFGDFGFSSPIIAIPPYRDKKIKVKCANSNGFKEPAEIKEADLCGNCKFCTGVFSTATIASREFFDMACPSLEENRYSPTVTLVPPGCPHAGEWSAMFDGKWATRRLPSNRKEARCILVNDNRDTIFPHSWKVYRKDGKVSLAIQYCKMHVSSEADLVIPSYYYQIVQVNAVDGQTYVSCIHNGKKKIRNTVGTGDIDNITYTGKSVFFHWNSSSTGQAQMKKALWELAKAVSAELSELGYCKPMTAEMPDNADVQRMLFDIAAFNRFPMAMQQPLPNIYHHISEKARYMINDMRRDVQLGEFPRLLGIPDDPDLASMLMDGDSGKRDAAFILAKAGCDDVAAYKYALDDNVFPRVATALSVMSLFVAGGNADGMSLIPLIAARSFSPGGWTQWIAELATIPDVDDDRNGLEGARLAFESLLSTGSELPDENSIVAFSNAVLDARRDEQNRRFEEKDTVAYNSFGIEKLTWKRRKYSSDWEVVIPQGDSVITQPAMERAFGRISIGFSRLLELKQDENLAAIIEARAYFHIDRRKWTSRHQQEYLALKQKSHLDGRDSKRKAELDKMMRNAVVFDWSFETVFGEGILPLSKHAESVLRLWAKERKVKISQKSSATLRQLTKK